MHEFHTDFDDLYSCNIFFSGVNDDSVSCSDELVSLNSTGRYLIGCAFVKYEGDDQDQRLNYFNYQPNANGSDSCYTLFSFEAQGSVFSFCEYAGNKHFLSKAPPTDSSSAIIDKREIGFAAIPGEFPLSSPQLGSLANERALLSDVTL